MTEYEILKCAVYNAIGVGRANAASRSEICRKVGCGDRMLRRVIEDLRYDRPIVTDDNGKGYYIPETTKEGKAATAFWISRQEKRIRSIRKAMAGANQFINDDIPGQMDLFVDGGLEDGKAI